MRNFKIIGLDQGFLKQTRVFIFIPLLASTYKYITKIYKKEGGWVYI